MQNKNTYKVRVVGGEVAPQLNTLKGTPVKCASLLKGQISRGEPGSTGQGGLCYNSKECYPDRAMVVEWLKTSSIGACVCPRERR
jgi:hypothetical protein